MNRRPAKPQHKPARAARAPRIAPPTDWSEVADWYDKLVGESGSEYHQKVVLPGVMRLLGVKPGQRIIDVACGQGVLCRLLHQGGAEVTGIDSAAPLVTLARQRSDRSIRYEVGDVRELLRLPRLPRASFDAAACVLSIQNINPFAPVFEGAVQLLKPWGRFVLVMMHPCFRGPKATSWGWDAASGTQYRRIDRYLEPRKQPIVTHPGKDPGRYTWTFHRPMESYVKAMAKVGLLVDAMEEWTSHKVSTSGPRAGAENMARREIPMFLAIRAVLAPQPPAAQ